MFLTDVTRYGSRMLDQDKSQSPLNRVNVSYVDIGGGGCYNAYVAIPFKSGQCFLRKILWLMRQG